MFSKKDDDLITSLTVSGGLVQPVSSTESEAMVTYQCGVN